MMNNKDNRQTVWHGKVFHLDREEIVLLNGKKTVTEVVRHPGSSSIVPVLKDQSVILIHQYRPSIRDFIWETPSGTLLPGEDPLECAKRELMEECGYQGKRFVRLGEIFAVPGYSDERVYLFMATDLIPCPQHLDEDELLTPCAFPFDQVMEMVERHEIQDAMTIIGLKMAYSVWKERGQSF